MKNSARPTRNTTAAILLLPLILPMMGPAVASAETPKCPFDGKRPPLDAILRLAQKDRPALCRADLVNAHLVGEDLVQADLTGADLTGAILTRGKLTKSNLTGANLVEADLFHANLTEANLSEAYLTGTNLVGADLSRANLTDANLTEANLNGANLTGANLVRANLTRANLTGANLAEALLTKAILTWASLAEANLIRANLTGAVLEEANLTGANLTGANLTAAYLGEANLTGANLWGADLTGAFLGGANLHSAKFDPNPESLSSVKSIEFARNLSHLTFAVSPAALVVLRERFAKLGLRDQEREVTFAKLRTQQFQGLRADLARRIEASFSYLAFDLTCSYGLNYGRPLRILGASIPLLALVYALALRTRGRGALWRVWAPDRIWKDEGHAEPERLSWEWPGNPKRALFLRVFRGIGLAVLFSLLSAFYIGWRELNVGNWISRLQSREYTLRGTGWVRVVSGAQSLLSVYLLALWALTYFGRPFE